MGQKLVAALLIASACFAPAAQAASVVVTCEQLFSNGPDRLNPLRNELRALAPEARGTIIAYRNELLRFFLGKDNSLHEGPAFNMSRTEFDDRLREIPKLDEERRRPLLTRVQKYLYDYEGSHGFARWMADLTAEVAAEAQKSGTLKWGKSEAGFLELEKIVPYQQKYPEPVKVTAQNVALVDRAVLHKVLDRRARLFGFDKAAQQGFEYERAPGSQIIGVLASHPDFDILTQNFLRLVRNHVLFLDEFFTNKPHGQYPHIFQWLYLAERFTRDAKPGEDPMKLVFDAMSDGESGAGEIIMDTPGQKSPSSPNFITQMAKLFLPID